MKRWFILLAAVLILAVIGGAGYLGYRASQPTNRGVVQAPPTISVDRGDVVQSVTAPGQLVGMREQMLSLGIAGRLSKINVRAGDHVKAGQVLAELDSSDLALQVQQAKAALETAQARLALAQRGPDANDIAAAQAKLDAAKKSAPTATDIAAARAKLDSAKQNLADVQNGIDPVTKAKQALDQAKNNLWSAQINRDGIKAQVESGRVGKYQLDSANLQIANAELAVQQAQQAYNQAVANQTNTPLAQAQAQVKDAEAALARLLNNTSAQDIAAAQAAYQKALEGPTAEDIAVAQANVDSAQAALDQTKLKLKNAQLLAPFDGVVQDVRAKEGDMLSAGASLIQLTDLKALEARSTVTEEDYPLTQVGQSAQLYFDSQPDLVVTGTVTEIVPLRDASSTSPIYPVYIALDDVPDGLAPGMTVDGSILIAKRPNVLRLPRALVHARSDGTAQIQVWANGKTETRTIKTGLRGDHYIEILSGVSGGEQVVSR